MSTSKHIDKICVFAVVAALLISLLFMNGTAFGVQTQVRALGYESRLFDTSRVHTMDIIMDDWDGFLQTAQSEEYSICHVVIDGETFKNAGIRGKGNTSLSTVASMDSDRYSFKIEFDQYDSTGSYYGLDKLSLNNLIQDNTMMKDYLTYQMMNEFGVAAPLCSYVYITVNGEDWGLYLAVEGVEEAFLRRNYGNDYGELYKPDSINMGGGRGNGQEFNLDDVMNSSGEEESAGNTLPSAPEEFDSSQMGGRMPGGDSQQGGMQFGDMGNFGGMSMGSGETKLQYSDDNPDSYSTIFSSAKTDVTSADQARLIAALKTLSEGGDSAVDVESVIRYFVVHNYVVNGDSYTGSMVHNYYLYEEDGQLSMIPWDYNLAFGTFQGNSASDAVNDDIDAPLSVTGSDRPMIDWIFSSGEYTALYHQYFQEFLDTVDAGTMIANAKALIAPYVEKDPTKFCTCEEFEKGVETLTEFCRLRSQSVAQQLAGGEGAADASAITLSDMGTMNQGGGFGGKGQSPGGADGNLNAESAGTQSPSVPDSASDGSNSQMPGGQGGMQMPGQSGTPNSTADGDQQFSGFGGQGGMELPEGMENMIPGQGENSQTGFPDRGQTGTAATQENSQWILLAVTVVILAAGLLFAFKFKR